MNPKPNLNIVKKIEQELETLLKNEENTKLAEKQQTEKVKETMETATLIVPEKKDINLDTKNNDKKSIEKKKRTSLLRKKMGTR